MVDLITTERWDPAIQSLYCNNQVCSIPALIMEQSPVPVNDVPAQRNGSGPCAAVDDPWGGGNLFPAPCMNCSALTVCSWSQLLWQYCQSNIEISIIITDMRYRVMHTNKANYYI